MEQPNNPAPTLSYLFAVEVIEENLTIEQVPGMIRDFVIEIVERMTGKDVSGE